MSIKTNSKGSWGVAAGRDASAIMLDGYLRLGAAVVVRAIKDYQDQDIVKLVGALGWFLADGPVWLRWLAKLITTWTLCDQTRNACGWKRPGLKFRALFLVFVKKWQRRRIE